MPSSLLPIHITLDANHKWSEKPVPRDERTHISVILFTVVIVFHRSRSQSRLEVGKSCNSDEHWINQAPCSAPLPTEPARGSCTGMRAADFLVSEEIDF